MKMPIKEILTEAQRRIIENGLSDDYTLDEHMRDIEIIGRLTDLKLIAKNLISD